VLPAIMIAFLSELLQSEYCINAIDGIIKNVKNTYSFVPYSAFYSFSFDIQTWAHISLCRDHLFLSGLQGLFAKYRFATS